MRRNSSPDRDRRVIAAVLRWYHRHGRRLPWRSTTDPYRILVAEVMLQQTQVGRVLQSYPAFLRRFSSLRILARASQREVVVAWRGMGYNNRAVRLHRLARILRDHNGGRFPADAKTLRTLPGIGRYTAAAILSSAFRHPVPVVDVNVRRVLSRLFTPMPSVIAMRPEPEIWTCAGRLLPPARAYEWNQALMDLGATVCTARTPRCAACPLTRWCRSRARMRRNVPPVVRTEPSRAGIPDRIYRGRVVEELRRTKGRTGMAAGVIGKRVFPGFSPRESGWFDRLLDGLERDGLVRTEGSGALARRRVKLQ